MALRYLAPYVIDDLKTKMVFIAGPRQCGKTTFAKQLATAAGPFAYFNWDSRPHRQQLMKAEFSLPAGLTVLDEVHKYSRWKSWLKGLFDTRASDAQLLVTGSARLDLYRRGGDSMLGRYHLWRLHPFTLSELPQGLSRKSAVDALLKFGGFPEPLLRQDERFARRWRRERYERVLREDLRDLERVSDLAALELFVEQLRSRVGGLAVVANMARELEVAPKTLKRWLEVLERMYLIFSVRPWTKGVSRSVLKPPKVYFFDNGDVEGDDGARFENLVATHLLKRVQFLEDRDGYRYRLHYLRDRDGHEVDFVISKEGKLEELWEAKWADSMPSPALKLMTARLKPARAFHVYGSGLVSSKRQVHDVIRVGHAADLLSSLE